MKNKLITILFLLIITSLSFPGNNQNNSEVYIDTNGIMRWKGNNEEVSLFGVNYTVPFAYSYRAHKKLNLDLKKAMDIDIAQMVRLGLTAFRVHVWDREVSDREGNLLKNEHLDLFDYLLTKLAENGIKVIITPIGWWGTGWPEPDYETPGFSQIYKKVELITNPKAREAQKNYLKQFINHINTYNKFSYKDDPSVIAVEIINEPHHPDNEKQVIEYINEMYDILRSSGFTKPIFYNISENWSTKQANAVTKSKVEGVSFQWYPTGLVHNKELEGNYLINVNKYKVPSENIEGYNKKTKMVYEFDAADIGRSYLYPAMARSYREAGMQFATMFSYDPTQIAWSNTEYPTHFLNLLYTPSKAISLLITGKAFKNLPLYKDYGNYPANNHFGDFRVCYEEDLSEMNSVKEFYYSNNTKTFPVAYEKLEHIAGCGNSPIIKYDGTGAYFLDKIEEGIWRLEVYPDVYWINDPFEVASLSREAARLFWNQRKMKIDLPGIGKDVKLNSISSRDNFSPTVDGNEFTITPGIYLISSKKVNQQEIKKYLSEKENFLEGLYSPENKPDVIYVVNSSTPYYEVSHKIDLKFKIASERKIDSAYLFIRRLGWRRFEKYSLKNINGFDFVLSDSIKRMQTGKIEYCVSVKTGNEVYTFPDKVKSMPGNWDFSTNYLWSSTIISKNEPLVLLDAYRDRKDFIFPQWSETMRYQVDYKNGSISNQSALAVKVNYSENSSIPFGVQLNVSKYVRSLNNSLDNYNELILKARSIKDTACGIKINLITLEGNCIGKEVELKNSWQEYIIPINTMQNDDFLILPNSYPKFLPKIRRTDEMLSKYKNQINIMQFIQILCEQKNKTSNYEFEIESIYLNNKQP